MPVPLSVTGKNEGEGVREDRLYSGGYKAVLAVRPESEPGGGWIEVLWKLECPVGLNQKEICAHFNEEHLAQFEQSAEKIIVELRSEI